MANIFHTKERYLSFLDILPVVRILASKGLPSSVFIPIAEIISVEYCRLKRDLTTFKLHGYYWAKLWGWFL